MAGPGRVSLECKVRSRCVPAFPYSTRWFGRARRRTAAALWGVFQDAEDPERFLETFTVTTWDEHLRQHVERGTVADANLEAAARGFLSEGAVLVVRHFVWAYAVPAALPDTEPDVVPDAQPGPGPTAAPAATDPP